MISVVSIENTKCNMRWSIKVACRCHFIVHKLYVRPDNAIITYTSYMHIAKSSVVCSGKDAVGRSVTLNYAPHLKKDIWYSVKQMIENGSNVKMKWDQFIYEVDYKSGQLLIGIAQDSLMTRHDIKNMYNDLRRQECLNDQCDLANVACWYNQFSNKQFIKKQVIQNIPFIVCRQTNWIHSIMVEHSHNNKGIYIPDMGWVDISHESHLFVIIEIIFYMWNSNIIMCFFEFSINLIHWCFFSDDVSLAWVILLHNQIYDILKWLLELFSFGMI